VGFVGVLSEPASSRLAALFDLRPWRSPFGVGGSHRSRWRGPLKSARHRLILAALSNTALHETLNPIRIAVEGYFWGGVDKNIAARIADLRRVLGEPAFWVAHGITCLRQGKFNKDVVRLARNIKARDLVHGAAVSAT
jgi:hypothetical protein